MGGEWKFKQTRDYFYYKLGNKCIEAPREDPKVTSHLRETGAKGLSWYSKIVYTISSNPDRAHNTRDRKKKASSYCTSCNVAEVKSPGRCLNCKERERMKEEEIQRIREQFEQSRSFSEENWKAKLDEKTQIMKSILCEQETSRKRFESSLQIANEENIKLQQKLIANKTHEEQLAAKIRALEEQIQRNASIAQRTLVET